MKKPTILFVAPSCYPIDGAEANVNAKVIKALTDYGCIVDLISRKSTKSLCYPKSTDNYYFGKIRNIVEVDWYIKKDLKRIINHLKVFFKTGYCYIWADWAYPAIKACEELIENNHYDYIYSFNAPSEIIALYLHKKYGIKWVATWNDPYCWNKYPAPYGKGINGKISRLRTKLIKEIGRNVYFNIFPSKRLRDYMLKYMYGMKKDHTCICPHLVLEDMDIKTDYQSTNTLNLIHAGALGRERNPMTLLKGLKEFLLSHPDAKIELNLLGVFERADGSETERFISENGLGKYINLLSPVTYSESLHVISKNDVCLLVEAPCVEGIFLPSKVADYIQLNKPVFTISPSNGTLKDMYLTNEISYFADVTDSHSIANELSKIYNDFYNGNLISNYTNKFNTIKYIENQKKIWEKK